ncbi:MAG: GPR endopeptidase [Bacilli bacterium]|jgi:spore protease|nr:GPR endopeptidase [Bacilli bacterium]
MSKEIDLSKYQVRTDLAIEAVEGITKKDGINSKTETKNNIKITTVDVLEEGVKLINKKVGKYITIEFSDVTDNTNKEAVKNILQNELKQLLKHLNIKKDETCLIIGLGNDKSTADSLGPLVIDKIVVTKHLFELNVVDEGFRSVSAFSPGVMGQTGIETSEIIFGVVKRVQPDFLIIIDALAASSLSRINKTIQITDTGIHPGSGVGNMRKEISKEILNIPVIAIGVPTVVDAVTIVSDTINYMTQKVAFNKENINNPRHKLIIENELNYIEEGKKNNDLSSEDKQNLMGIIGTLTEEKRRQLIYEVLSPIGYNLIVTPKEVDFLIKKLSDIIAGGINNALHRQINQS